MEMRELVIRPKGVAQLCALAIVSLLLLHTGSQVARFVFGRDYQLGLASKVYLGAETSIPNWFSTILLLACGAVLLAIAAVQRRADSRYWLVLGIVFLALSLDESAALHDLASPFFAGVFVWLAGAVGGPFVALARKPNYGWEIPGAIVSLIVAISYIPFLLRLPRSTRNAFVASGVVYIGGAVGIDFIEGWYSGLYGPKNPTFVALLTCEETLEMVGASLFLCALLRYGSSELGAVRIRFCGSVDTLEEREAVSTGGRRELRTVRAGGARGTGSRPNS
jgi:hypothetical protein